MQEENELSIAQKRLLRRKKNGIDSQQINFKYDSNKETYEGLLDLQLSEEEIFAGTTQYVKRMNNINQEFIKKTGLDRTDISFLFICVSLQCVRQYLFTDFKKRYSEGSDEHKDATRENISSYNKKTEKYNDLKSIDGKKGGYYYCKIEDIISDLGVPYDTTMGSPDQGVNLGGKNHRTRTLGHDPIVGLIVGTANILTNTITLHNLKSYHVRRKPISNGKLYKHMYSSADNGKIIDSVTKRIKNEKEAVAVALIKQRLHLKSDAYTTKSLPIPFSQMVSYEHAETLASYGIDFANIMTVGKQTSFAILINMIIAMLHRLTYDTDKEEYLDLFKVKTKKILMYSNMIASVSNVIYVAITENYNKLDIGGLLVTLHRIHSDEKFIRRVQYEYLNSELSTVYNARLQEAEAEFLSAMKKIR